MDDLRGRIALVTGASRGIGRDIALALAEAGADVAINYCSSETDALSARDRIVATGRKSVALQADVSLADRVQALVGETTRQLGPVDILVNNAGIARVQRSGGIQEHDWDYVLSMNLKSCFLMTEAVLPGMRQRGWGRIINISSVAAQTGGVVGPHYAASKAGMHGLTHFYARHLASEGITVNAIAPALIETDMLAANPSATAAHIPVGRLGKVDEVSSVAVMLARNSYITGQTINVNGGWYMS
ncbi:MAG TPA: 3-oxoacyl-ACP reductase family protein [Bryobacteraceae bacterium]|nr:3-oxoacyl-ACP reductase family protein [Bryobacteraceae bacterium]